MRIKFNDLLMEYSNLIRRVIGELESIHGSKWSDSMDDRRTELSALIQNLKTELFRLESEDLEEEIVGYETIFDASFDSPVDLSDVIEMPLVETYEERDL